MWSEDTNMFEQLGDQIEAMKQKARGRKVFSIGEEVEIAGVMFSIFNITDSSLILRPVQKLNPKYLKRLEDSMLEVGA
jgi:hypothetical protein